MKHVSIATALNDHRDDPEVVRRAKSGDLKAFEALVSRDGTDFRVTLRPR